MSLDILAVLSALWGIGADPLACSYVPRRVGVEIMEGARPRSAIAIYAFVDVHVIPMDTERVILNQTVLVENGRIVALGPTSQVKVPPGAVRIDGRGRYLMPGLGDMHVHDHARDIAGNDYDEIAARVALHVADGVTTIRHLAADYAMRKYAALFQKMKTMGSPRIYLPAIFMGKNRGYPDWSRSLDWPDSMATYLAAAKEAGYDYVAANTRLVYGRQQSPVVDSLLDAARQLAMPVASHVHERSFGKMLALGAFGGSEEHLTAFADTLGLWVRGRGKPFSHSLAPEEADAMISKIPALAAAVRRAGVWITPTLDCIENNFQVSSGRLLVLREIVKALQEAGVRLLLAGDDGRRVHDELMAWVRAGLTPYQGLVAGTRNVAQYFGVQDSGGTIAPGKWADLVLLYGNPLDDIRYTREPAGVMVQDRWYDRAALDRGVLGFSSVMPRYDTWLKVNVLPGRKWNPELAELRTTLARHVEAFDALADSLAMMAVPGQRQDEAAQRLRLTMAEILGKIRATLPLENRVEFDPVVRVWLREQMRQGVSLIVPGVSPLP